MMKGSRIQLLPKAFGTTKAFGNGGLFYFISSFGLVEWSRVQLLPKAFGTTKAFGNGSLPFFTKYDFLKFSNFSQTFNSLKNLKLQSKNLCFSIDFTYL